MKARTILTAALLSVCALTSIAQAEKPAGGEKKGPNPAKILAKLDVDKNGTLSSEEVAKNKMLTARFQKIDTNKDGELDLEELKAAKPKKAKKHQKSAVESDGEE